MSSLAFSLACCGSLGLPDHPPAARRVRPPSKKGRQRPGLDTVEEEDADGPEVFAAPSYHTVAGQVTATKQGEKLGIQARSRQAQSPKFDARPVFDCSPQRYRVPASASRSALQERSSSEPAIRSRSSPKAESKARLKGAGEASLHKPVVGNPKKKNDLNCTADAHFAISAASKLCEKQLEELQSLLLSPEKSPKNSLEVATSSDCHEVPHDSNVEATKSPTSTEFSKSPTTLSTKIADGSRTQPMLRMGQHSRGIIAGILKPIASQKFGKSKSVGRSLRLKNAKFSHRRVSVENGMETEEFDPSGLHVDHLKTFHPVEAIRLALMLCGPMQEVHGVLDSNRSGVISQSEFESGLHSLGIPWQELTGLTSMRTLWKHFDSDHNGTLDVKELLGIDGEEMEHLQFKLLTTAEQWTNWSDRARKLGPVREPHWIPNDIERIKQIEHDMSKEQENEQERSRMKAMMVKGVHLKHPSYVATHLPRDLSEQNIAKQKRDDLEMVDKRCKKIRNGLQAAATSRRELAKCVREIQAVNHKEERERAIAKKKQQETDKFKEAAKMLGGQWGKPKDSTQMINFFSEESLGLTPEEIALRHLARDLGIPIPDAEVIRRCFDYFDEDKSGEIDKTEFKCLLRQMLGAKSPDQEISDSKIDQYWRHINHDGSDGISFPEFLRWYFFESGAPIPLSGSVVNVASDYLE